MNKDPRPNIIDALAMLVNGGWKFGKKMWHHPDYATNFADPREAAHLLKCLEECKYPLQADLVLHFEKLLGVKKSCLSLTLTR